MEQQLTPATGVSRNSRVQEGKLRGDLASSSVVTPSFKVDEGYSDETKSQLENEVTQSTEESSALPGWMLSSNETDRAGT